MKGYYVPNGYMGFVEGKYILFASESEYYEYMKGEQICEQSNRKQRYV